MADYDMDPDAVTRSINRLRAAGEAFGSAWESRKKAIQAAQSGFGHDGLAQAFLEKYQPLAEKLMANADAIPTSYGRLCDDALGCVRDYLAAEHQGTSSVRRLTGTNDQETSTWR
ncbi:hypothetical protein GCM10011581_33780 [Saccharopolyspora subtropica]|uniref:Uncharacterized protein n=1 Tax=Saccharopolyspora thermophila TaxID=89367 RepID=A0A917K031_9PSEU|nr:hypothetical protein [Saccharopolyspora subtropica]GGI93903.1 hypothetical protein GCM10011581_33780 [Saccharopolyspora subtropica]